MRLWTHRLLLSGRAKSSLWLDRMDYWNMHVPNITLLVVYILCLKVLAEIRGPGLLVIACAEFNGDYRVHRQQGKCDEQEKDGT